jgi:transcriptional regulator with XRE-family HTH domain
MGKPVAEAVPTELGLRLKSFRESADVTQRMLSLAAALSPSVVWQIECGLIQAPGAEVMSDIAAALGVSLEWLVSGRGKAPTETQRRAASDLVVRAAEKRSTGTEG